MGIAIRRAIFDDAAAIAHVHVSSWRSTYAGIVPDEFLRSLDVDARAARWSENLAAQSSIPFVAEDAAKIVGFACGGKLREPIDGFDAELFAIYLLHGHQGKGIGRRLTRTLIEALRSAGFTSMAVWVLAQNPAVEFYKRLGAVPIASPIACKTIEIGGAQLEEIALGWPDLDRSFPPQWQAAGSGP